MSLVEFRVIVRKAVCKVLAVRYASRFIVTPGFRREHILHCFPKLFWVLSPFLSFIFVIVSFSFSLRIVAVVSQCSFSTLLFVFLALRRTFQFGINPRSRPSFDPFVDDGCMLVKNASNDGVENIHSSVYIWCKDGLRSMFLMVYFTRASN